MVHLGKEMYSWVSKHRLTGLNITCRRVTSGKYVTNCYAAVRTADFRLNDRSPNVILPCTISKNTEL